MPPPNSGAEAKEFGRMSQQQVCQVDHQRSGWRLRQDGNIGNNPAREEPFDRAFRFRIAGGAGIEIRLNQCQAIIVLSPNNVEIARLQAGK